MRRIEVHLKEETIKELLGSSDLTTAVAALAGSNFNRVNGWLKNRSEKLTQYAVLLSISEVLKKPLNEIAEISK